MCGHACAVIRLYLPLHVRLKRFLRIGGVRLRRRGCPAGMGRREPASKPVTQLEIGLARFLIAPRGRTHSLGPAIYGLNRPVHGKGNASNGGDRVLFSPGLRGRQVPDIFRNWLEQNHPNRLSFR
jgi:hypothetical protein